MSQIVLQPFERLHSAGERDVSFARLTAFRLQQRFVCFLCPVKFGAQGLDHFIFRRLRILFGLRGFVQLFRQFVQLVLQFLIFFFQRDLVVLQGAVLILQRLGVGKRACAGGIQFGNLCFRGMCLQNQ